VGRGERIERKKGREGGRKEGKGRKERGKEGKREEKE
jgi:hypothetical protein